MTEDDLRHIERTAHALASWGMHMQADMIHSLIAEVRRLRTVAGMKSSTNYSELYAAMHPDSPTIPLGVDEAAELAKLLVRKHGGHQNARRILVLPEPELTITCPVTEAEKAELIADLQQTPVAELVQFWDQRNGVVGMGCKLKPMSNEVEPQHVVEGK